MLYVLLTPTNITTLRLPSSNPDHLSSIFRFSSGITRSTKHTASYFVKRAPGNREPSAALVGMVGNGNRIDELVLWGWQAENA